jgi:hypothetical protein
MNRNQSKTPLTSLSDDELRQEVIRRKTLYHVYIGIIVAMTVFAVLNAARRGSLIFSVMPLCFLPMLTLIRKNYQDAKAEQQNRIP